MSDNLSTDMMHVRHALAEIVRPAPPFYRAAVMRMVNHYERFLQTSSDAELEDLDAFLYHDERPWALLQAPTGRGKTALLIQWLAHVYAANKQQHTPVVWTPVFAAISMRYQTNSRRITLRSLAQTLAVFYGDTEHVHIYNMSPDQLRPIIASYLYRDPPEGKALLLVLDGLDETEGWQPARDILPQAPMPYLRLLVSVRQKADMTYADWLDVLEWQEKHTVNMTLPEMSRQAMGDLLHDVCQPLHGLHPRLDVQSEIERISEGDPLTLHILVSSLQNHVLDPQTLPQLPAGLEPYVHDWLHKQEQHNPHIAALFTLLGLCAMAMGTLSNEDLLELAPDVFQDSDVVSQAVQIARHLIVGDGSTDDGYVFEHLRLRELFREHILLQQERAELQQRFVSYGQEWHENRRTHLTNYVRRYWIEHLAEAGAWERIYSVLTNTVAADKRFYQPWARARFNAEGNYVGYLSDVDILWRQTEQQKNIPAGFRCAYIAASIRSISGNILPSLLAGLMAVGIPEGKWSAALALKHVLQIPAQTQKVRALRALGACDVCAFQDEHDLVIEVIRSFTDDVWQAEAIRAMAEVLSNMCIDEALDMARTIQQEDARTLALIGLVPYAQLEQQDVLYDEIVHTIGMIAHDRSRTRVLTTLIPTLPAALLPNVCTLIDTIEHETFRTEALVSVAMHPSAIEWPEMSERARAVARRLISKERFADALPLIVRHVPVEQQQAIFADILAAIRVVRTHDARAQALLALLASFPESESGHAALEMPYTKAQIMTEAMDAIVAITDTKKRFRLLATTAAHMPLEQQQTVFLQAFTEACAIDDEKERAEALKSLAPCVPVIAETPLFTQVLRAVRFIENPMWVATTLIAMLPAIPTDSQHNVCSEALAAARSVGDEWQRTELLAAIAPHTPESLHRALLDAARSINDQWQRAEALTMLAPHLPSKQQPYIYAEALVDSRAIADEPQRYRLLTALAAHLPSTRQPQIYAEALTFARCIVDERQRIGLLATLAPRLPAKQQRDVYTDILSIVQAEHNQSWGIEALAELVPMLPSALLPEALAMAYTIPDAWKRIQVLNALASYLPTHQQHETFVDILAIARSIASEWHRADVLRLIAPHLPALLLAEEALADVRTITHELYRSNALTALAPHLPTRLLPDALNLARSIGNTSWRAETLMALFPYLHTDMLDQALSAAYEIDDAPCRARVLSILVPQISLDERYDVCEKALEDAESISYVRWRADVVATLAPHLPSKLLSDALEIARSMNDKEERARAITALAPHWKGGALIQEAFTIACAIANEERRSHALVSLVAFLPHELLLESLVATRTIENGEDRYHAIIKMTPYLPPDVQPAAYAEAFEAASTIVDTHQCCIALLRLAPRLPSGQQPAVYAEAFGAARAIPNDATRIEALTLFARNMSTWSVRSPSHKTAAMAIWQASMRLMSGYGRVSFAESLEVLMPWLVALTTLEERVKIADAIDEIVRCWP